MIRRRRIWWPSCGCCRSGALGHAAVRHVRFRKDATDAEGQHGPAVNNFRRVTPRTETHLVVTMKHPATDSVQRPTQALLGVEPFCAAMAFSSLIGRITRCFAHV